jgi:hypothetical protein
MKKHKQAIMSVAAVSLLLIGLSTSLSSFSTYSAASSGTTGTTTGTTTTAPGGNNGELTNGIPCIYTEDVILSGVYIGYDIITGFGVSCLLGGNNCNVDDYKQVKNCAGTATRFIPGSR